MRIGPLCVSAFDFLSSTSNYGRSMGTPTELPHSVHDPS
jgi:hypothetical protein